MTDQQEIERRILDAADALQAKLGRRPTVTEVRREARTDQNRVAEVMRKWREQQLVAAATRSLPLPMALQAEVGRIWELIWDRALAAATDARAAVLAVEQGEQRAELEASVRELSSETVALQARLAEADERERGHITRAASAEALAAELARREAEAREELARARTDCETLRQRLAAVGAASEADARRLREELAEALTLAEQRMTEFTEWAGTLGRSSGRDMAATMTRATLIETAQALDTRIVERLHDLLRRISVEPEEIERDRSAARIPPRQSGPAAEGAADGAAPVVVSPRHAPDPDEDAELELPIGP